jgi:hypothetical protein
VLLRRRTLRALRPAPLVDEVCDVHRRVARREECERVPRANILHKNSAPESHVVALRRTVFAVQFCVGCSM